MKRNEDFKKALGQPDEYFRQSVIDTLDQLNMQAEKESRPQRRYTARLIASFAALVLVITGIIVSRQYIPGIRPDGHVDTINPTPTVATQVTKSSSVVDTVFTTLTFREAVRDGDDIRFTVEIQPKYEKNLIVSPNYLLTSACKYTADFYGIQPENPEQSMYNWVVDHGYQEAITVELGSPWNGIDGVQHNIYHQEKFQLRDDGSAVMTLVGPAADDNVYDLEWHIVPWNMEDHGNSFHPELHDHGTIRLEVTDTQKFAVTVIRPSSLPDIESSNGNSSTTQANNLPVLDTEFATITLRNAIIQDYNIRMTFEIRPKFENCFVMDAQHFPSSLCKYASVVYGIQVDYPEQTLTQWAEDHGYQEIMHASIVSPQDEAYSTFHTESCLQTGDGSVLMTIAGAALPDSLVYDMEWAAVCWEPGSTDTRSESQTMHIDLSTAAVTTRPSTGTPSVRTDPADFTVRKAVRKGSGIYADVEVVPRHENSLILISGINPYTDSPEKIGKTPDYAGQSIMKWAVAHGYQEVFRFMITTDFNPDIVQKPGVTYTEPAPAFYTENDPVEYRDDDSSVIRVVGTTVPDRQLYRLLLVLHQWDLSKADSVNSSEGSHNSIIMDSQIARSITFSVSEPDKKPQAVAEHSSQSDPAPAEPTPEVIPDIPPVEEYTAQAWALDEKGYTDLLENINHRVGQVYCVKGTVQEVSSIDPLRVLVNTGEGSASQPIFVECPWYRDFTWEPGTYYRIYADVTSVEDNMPILTARYSYTQSKRNTLETDLATVTFREAVIQNNEIHLSFDVRPKHEKCFVYDSQHQLLSRCKDVSSFYGIQADDPEQDLSQWVKEHGYEEIMHVSIAPPNNGEYGSFRTESCQQMDDGSVRMTIVGPALSDSLVYDIEWDTTDYQTGRTHYQSESQIMHLDLSETDVTTLPSTSTSSVSTDLATLNVREAKTDGYGVFLQVEVQPKEEKTLVVANSLITDDSVMKLGIDEQKSIYQWAVDNDYKLLIVDFNSPTDTTDGDTGLNRGFHPYCKNPSFIEENGSTVIKVFGYAIPDTTQYELEFDLITPDQHSSESPVYRLQETGVIPVTVSETEEPKVIAEYKAVSSSSADYPTPDATLTLLQSPCSDYCELRSSDTKHVPPDSGYYCFVLSNDFFADDKFVEWGEGNDFILTKRTLEENNTFVLLHSWKFPKTIPDKFRLSATSDYYSGLYEKVK